MYADMVGYSRLISLDDQGTLDRLRTLRREVIDPAIAEYGGRLVQTGGDSLLIVFESIDGAVRCAVKVQQQIPVLDGDQTQDRAIRFRAGIDIGDAIPDGTDLHGDAVNVAARLQAECPPGGVCVSRSVRDHIHGRLGLDFEELGLLNLKNIARPVEAFLVTLEVATSPVEPSLVHKAHQPSTESPAEQAPPDRPSIAVLPFQNISDDPEQAYFADGMTVEIITALSRIRSFLVIARASSFTYKDRAVDVRQVGRELGVRYVVEGSVRKSGDRVRIAGQLVDAASGAQLWADRFDGAMEDVFTLEDRVAASLIGAIEPHIRDAEINRARRKPPGNLQAYDLVLRALPHLYIYDQAEHAEAVRLLRQAIEMAPTYALALALLARCVWISVAASWLRDTGPARAEALRLARLALAHGGDDPEVLAQAGMQIGVGGDIYGGIALAEQALSLNSNSITAITVAG